MIMAFVAICTFMAVTFETALWLAVLAALLMAARTALDYNVQGFDEIAGGLAVAFCLVVVYRVEYYKRKRYVVALHFADVERRTSQLLEVAMPPAVAQYCALHGSDACFVHPVKRAPVLFVSIVDFADVTGSFESASALFSTLDKMLVAFDALTEAAGLYVTAPLLRLRPLPLRYYYYYYAPRCCCCSYTTDSSSSS